MTTKQLTAPTTIRIEPEIKTWLLQKAHIEKRNISNLINYLLEQSRQAEEVQKPEFTYLTIEQRNEIVERWANRHQAK